MSAVRTLREELVRSQELTAKLTVDLEASNQYLDRQRREAHYLQQDNRRQRDEIRRLMGKVAGLQIVSGWGSR